MTLTPGSITMADLDCPPRFGTDRDLSRGTIGPAIGKVAAHLGTPFMPWQQFVADVVGEVDDRGRFVYDEYGLTVPRQSGKSTWVLAKGVQRCTATTFYRGRQRVVYTAQTRNKAREKWEEDYAGALDLSPYARTTTTHKGNGNEHFKFENGSRFGIEASTEKAGHGGTLDEAFIDEAFAHQDGRLEQGFRPAMITRAMKQLGWISTAGWIDGSPYLSDKVQRGRRIVERRDRAGLAYFEWSAPDDADTDDEDVWRLCMPALGYTITIEAIRAELAAMEDNLNDFRRAYLNLWVPKVTPEASPLDLDSWLALADPTSEIVGSPVLAVEVPYDRSTAIIAAAGERADDDRHVEILEPTPERSGTWWLVERVAEVVKRSRVSTIVLDASGPAGAFEDDIRKAVGRHVDVVPLSLRQMGQATGGLVEAVNAGRIHHLGDPLLDAGVKAAVRRWNGDLYVWRRKGASEVAALNGATMAHYAVGLAARGKRRSGVVV